MILAIGSTNKVKVQALEEAIKSYPIFENARLITCDVPSEVSSQPMSLSETIRGAQNRAKKAYEACVECAYGFGIESGLVEVPEAKTGYLETSICCIYDGEGFIMGQSCAFELPQKIIDLIINEKMDLGQACFTGGFTNNPKLGAAEGFIGILTGGRITRKDYTLQSIITALIQVENGALFSQQAVVN